MNQGLRKPLVASANPAAAGFYIRGPRPKGWHRGQKQVPRFCTRTRSMVQPQMGAGFAPSMSNLEIEMDCVQLALVSFSPGPLARLEFPVTWPSSPDSIPS